MWDTPAPILRLLLRLCHQGTGCSLRKLGGDFIPALSFAQETAATADHSAEGNCTSHSHMAGGESEKG